MPDAPLGFGAPARDCLCTEFTMDADSFNSNIIPDGPSRSRLLSESPLLASYASSSRTGPGGDDLSVSELSLNDRLGRRPFSLLPHNEDTTFTARQPDDVDNNPEQRNEPQTPRVRTRDEKLQNDLFVLRKLNAAFAAYNDALRTTESSSEVCSKVLGFGRRPNHTWCLREW